MPATRHGRAGCCPRVASKVLWLEPERTESGASGSPSGFSLIELIVALLIVGVMTALVVPLASSVMDTNRGLRTSAELVRIHRAVVGDPADGTYGYVGDVGRFPASLMDLVRKPQSDPAGWNGPYLAEARIVNGALHDAYGSPIECFHLRDSSTSVPGRPVRFAVISRGPDRTSTNTYAAPNECGGGPPTFLGTLPSSGSYAASAVNVDNVVYPRFTDNAGLLDYQHVGRLSITIFNYDGNDLIEATVPGCPHLYTIAVTSVPRGAADTFSMPFNPGKNSVDLPQGLYRVRVTSPLAAGALWEERLAVTPGHPISHEARVGNLDSSTTANGTLQPTNLIDFASGPDKVQIWQTLAPPDDFVGEVALNNTETFAAVKRCGGIIVRQNNSSGAIVDAFTQPYLTAAYARKINLNSLFTLTVINRNSSNLDARNQLLVYDTGLLAGVVSSHGSAKARALFNFKAGNPYTLYDRTGALVASGTMPAANTTISFN